MPPMDGQKYRSPVLNVGIFQQAFEKVVYEIDWKKDDGHNGPESAMLHTQVPPFSAQYGFLKTAANGIHPAVK